MRDIDKNKTELVEELKEIRQRIAGLSQVEFECICAKKALHNEKRYIEASLNAQQDTFFLFEPGTGKAIRWNRAFNDVSGYTDEEISKLKVPESYYSPDDLKKATTVVNDVMDKRTGTIELELICKDGTKVPFEYKLSLIRDAGEKTDFIISIGRDISDRKLSERSLVFERAQLLSIFDSIDEFIYVSDINTYEILFVNQKMKNVFQKDLIGGTCYREFQGIDAPCEFCTNEIIQKQKPEPYRWEYYNPIIDKYIAIVDRIIRWPDGRDVRFEIAIDITEHKCVEESLRVSEEKYRAISESALDPIFCKDLDSRYTFVNPAMEILLGRPASELIGLTPGEVFDAESAAIVEDVDAPVFRGEVNNEIRTLNIRGENRTFHTVQVPLRDSGGKVVGISGIVRDITDRKKAEEVLLKMQKLESIGTLAGGVAHDFNNILMGLFGNISMAKEEISKDHPAFCFIKEAETSVSRATYLTKQLLTFAKGGDPVKEIFKLRTLINEVVHFDLSGSNVLPVFDQGDDFMLVEADKGQVQQVFSNLAINAREAMPDGGHLYLNLEKTEISGRTAVHLKKGKYIKIVFRDEGTGISQKHLRKIFDPYFTTKQTGSGLGLATVYSIVNKHGGHIDVDSNAGKGATFTIYLPESKSQNIEIVKKTAEPSSVWKKKVRILVMDDNEMICTLVTKMLEKTGFSVEPVSDGKQAVELYKRSLEEGNPFDVVIMDHTVPSGIGGQKAIKNILAIDPDAKAIVSSGYADDPVMAKYAEYGFKGVVVKPYTRHELLKVLSKVLQK
ncbi:MAG: PAS domain S-box protein [Candidatus Theseobacter exili]|nr:PAS domain S-box protein [Candidatus Theseobacter exili]